MQHAAPNDPFVAVRLSTFVYREREEFFDYAADPDALRNLIDDPKYADQIARHRAAMVGFMTRTHDHILNVFKNRDDEETVQAYMAKVESESAERRKKKRAQKQNGGAKRKRKLISIVPGDAKSGEPLTVTINHKLPKALGEQKVHVTLKSGNQKRLDRKVIKVSGTGQTTVTFNVDAGKIVNGRVLYAAFVGEDYGSNLQHVTSKPVKVR